MLCREIITEGKNGGRMPEGPCEMVQVRDDSGSDRHSSISSSDYDKVGICFRGKDNKIYSMMGGQKCWGKEKRIVRDFSLRNWMCLSVRSGGG